MDIFTVLEKNENRYPDLEKVALEEEWADGLIYCDMEGFAIGEDGNLYLLDECGKYRSVPYGRFRVFPIPSETPNVCPFCGSNKIEIAKAEKPAYEYWKEEWHKNGTEPAKRCECKWCGAAGPMTPIHEGEDEKEAD